MSTSDFSASEWESGKPGALVHQAVSRSNGGSLHRRSVAELVSLSGATNS